MRLFKLLFLVIIISEVLKLVPPDRMLPFAPSFYKDPRSANLEYANVDFHHLLATSGNQTLHFPKLREQENIHIKAQQHEAARQARLNKKLEKMLKTFLIVARGTAPAVLVAFLHFYF